MNQPLPTHWHRHYHFFLGGQFFSGITSLIVQYALIWQLTQTTGSATILSIAMLLGMLPIVLLTPLAGPVIDRVNKKGLLICTDWIIAAIALLLAIVGGTNRAALPTWLISLSLFLRAVAQSVQQPTVQAAVPVMVPEDRLAATNGQLATMQSLNTILAPALGALLFSIIPVNGLVLLDVVGAITGTAFLIPVRLIQTADQGDTIHLIKDAVVGYQLLRKKHGLWQLIWIQALFSLVLLPAASLYPLMTVKHFHGTIAQAGLVETVYAAGMLIGGLCISFMPNWHNRTHPMLAAYLIIGITVGLSGIMPGTPSGFWAFTGLNVLAGFASPFLGTLFMTMLQQSFPAAQLGRVLGIAMAIMSLAGPAGLIAAGPLADLLGVNVLFMIAGIGTLLCAVLLRCLPMAWRYDDDLQTNQNG